MNERLPAALEATALMRQAESAGGFATLLRRGDPDRGSLLVVVSSRGRHLSCLERSLNPAGTYGWQRVGPDDSESSGVLTTFLERRARFDADLWLIELDIAEPERFIAEMTASG